MLRNEFVKRVTKVESYNGRFIFVKISANIDIVIVQVYVTTIDHDDEEIEKNI